MEEEAKDECYGPTTQLEDKMVPTTGLNDTTVELKVSSILKLNVWLDTNSAISSATASMTETSTGSLIISRTRVDPLIDEEEAEALRSPAEFTCDMSTVAFSNLIL